MDDINKRATIRIEAIAKIKKMAQEGKSFKEIKTYLDRYFPNVIRDNHLRIFMKK